MGGRRTVGGRCLSSPMTTTADDLDTPAGVLAFARDSVARTYAAEVDKLHPAIAWAATHSADSMDDAACYPGFESELALAGPGAPLVAEFAVAELAVALRLTTDAGRVFLGLAMELRYRLPKVWKRVTAGDLAPWRARKVAEQTMTLSMEAAAFVDAHVAAFAHKISHARLERLVEEAVTRFMPAEAEARRQAAAESRHFDIHTNHTTAEGVVDVTGTLDLADALDLDAAVTRGAADLKQLGCAESLDVRRSLAVGGMARRQLTLDLNSDQPEDDRPVKPVKARQVVLYVHISHAALTGSTGVGGCDLARVENTRGFVSAEQVRGWCANPDTQVIVKPVIDLNGHLRVDAYEVPDRLKEFTVLRDGHCVFPGCGRPARRGDNDHIDEHAGGGATDDRNLAPLCRGHHRLKTHGGWTYVMLQPGIYLWRSPLGQRALVTGAGTTYLDQVTYPVGRRRPT